MNFLLPVPSDFSFLETIDAHGWRALLPFVWNAESATLARIERLNDGRVVRLTLCEESPHALRVTISEPADEAEIAARVRRMLQLDLSLADFHAYCAARSELDHIPARRQGRLLRCPTLWEDVVKVILTTNTTWTQTKAMNARLIAHFGTSYPTEPDQRAFPTPQQIAAVSPEVFAEKAKLGYRAPAVHHLATTITQGEFDLEGLQTAEWDSPTLWKRLLALRGVGPYAASCLMLYLGRGERVNVDSWARTLVGKELGRPVTDAEVHAFFEPYGTWRGLVYTFYAWRASPDE